MYCRVYNLMDVINISKLGVLQRYSTRENQFWVTLVAAKWVIVVPE